MSETRTFRARGFITGDYECFCLADAKNPPDQSEESRVYPGAWFRHLDQGEMYEFEITVKANRATR